MDNTRSVTIFTLKSSLFLFDLRDWSASNVKFFPLSVKCFIHFVSHLIYHYGRSFFLFRPFPRFFQRDSSIEPTLTGSLPSSLGLETQINPLPARHVSPGSRSRTLFSSYPCKVLIVPPPRSRSCLSYSPLFILCGISFGRLPFLNGNRLGVCVWFLGYLVKRK